MDTNTKQTLLYLSHPKSYVEMENLMSEGWRIVEFKPASTSQYGHGCWVLLEKKKRTRKTTK